MLKTIIGKLKKKKKKKLKKITLTQNRVLNKIKKYKPKTDARKIK